MQAQPARRRVATGRRGAVGMRLARCLLLVLFVSASLMLSARGQSGAGGAPLWNEAVGDNTNLMNLFAPPPSAAPAGPSPLELWQRQQAGLVAQPAAQPASTQAILTELAVALLRAATQPGQQMMQRPMAQQPAGMMQGFPPMMPPQSMAPQPQPYRNLYGPQPAAPPSDVSLLAQRSQQRDTILPLASPSTNSYGFSVPPADVQRRLRARRPKPASDVQRFARIPSRPDPIQRWMAQHPVRPFSLEQAVKKAPERRLPTPAPQKTFHLRTRHFRQAPAEPARAEVQELAAAASHNPFASAPALIEKSESAADSDSLSTVDSPALLAFSEAEKALQEADQTLDAQDQPALVELGAQTHAGVRMRSRGKAKQAAPLRRLPGSRAPKSEFALAEPSADLGKMFRSIMKARKAKAAAGEH